MSPLFRYFIAFVVVCLIGAAAVEAQAATIVATCTPPTRNTNGTTITGSISYSFHYGTSPTALNSTFNSATCGATITVPDPAPGASVTYYVGVRAIVAGQASDLSNLVSVVKSTPLPTPEPPTGLRVIEPVAYRLDAGSHNRVTFARIGTVPLDTVCQSNYSATVNGVTMHMIEKRVYATPVGSLPYQVWARCG